VHCVLIKAKRGPYWPHLLKDNLRPKNMHIDWSKVGLLFHCLASQISWVPLLDICPCVSLTSCLYPLDGAWCLVHRLGRLSILIRMTFFQFFLP
jgi:hypothetical protein